MKEKVIPLTPKKELNGTYLQDRAIIKTFLSQWKSASRGQHLDTPWAIDLEQYRNGLKESSDRSEYIEPVICTLAVSDIHLPIDEIKNFLNLENPSKIEITLTMIQPFVETKDQLFRNKETKWYKLWNNEFLEFIRQKDKENKIDLTAMDNALLEHFLLDLENDL